MNSFIYPAIFVKDEINSGYKVLFPDLEITTDGAFVEEAFLYAEALLKAYFAYAIKYDLGYNLPSEFDKVNRKLGKNEFVMLIRARVSKKDIE